MDIYTELDEAREAVADEYRRADLRQRLATLEAQADADRRQADAGAVLATRRDEAAQAVAKARDELDDLGAEFIDWTSTGWSIARRLAEIEAPVYSALAGLATAARSNAAAQIAPGATEAAILTPWGAIIDAELSQAGADELEALPAGGNEFVDELKTAILGHVRRHSKIYEPSHGHRQFERRRLGRP